MATTLNSLLSFVKAFVRWQEGDRVAPFDVLAQHQYGDGLLLRINRESVTNRANKAEIASYIWVSNKKSTPYLYVFLDSLEGLGVRNLSHRIQVLSSDRMIYDESVKTNIHLSESFWLGNNRQAVSIVLKLLYYCRERSYEETDWTWELNSCRKQLLGAEFTDYSQGKARDDYRYSLDRYELRFSAPSKLNPIILEKMSDIINPKPPPPRSRVIEIMLIGGILIGITWLWVSR